MKTSSIFPACAASVSLLLAGCYSNPLYRGYSAQPLKLNDAYSNLVGELTTAPPGKQPLVAKECFSPATSTIPAPAAVQQANGTQGTLPGTAAPTCEQQRNEAIAALVISSEDACLAHRRSMYGNEAAANITLGTMTNLFAGAAAAITNEKYRPVYAALALFSNSERSLVNETVYKQMLVTSVDKKIVEMREAKMQEIELSWKKPLSEYGLNQAIQDVARLHATCSFMEGLQKALDEGTQGQPAQKILRLKATLQTLTAEYDAAPNKGTPTATGLKARIENINAILMKEEGK